MATTKTRSTTRSTKKKKEPVVIEETPTTTTAVNKTAETTTGTVVMVPKEEATTTPTGDTGDGAYSKIGKDVAPVLQHIHQSTFTIPDDQWAEWSEHAWNFLNDKIKAATQVHKNLKKPFDDGIKGLTHAYKEVVGPWEEARSVLERALLEWKWVCDQQAAQRAQEHARRRDEEVAQIHQQTGQPIEQIEQSFPVTPPAPLTAPLTATSTRRRARWRTTGETIPPYHRGVPLYILDMKMLDALRQEAGEDLGLAPPGIEFYWDETLVRKAGHGGD